MSSQEYWQNPANRERQRLRMQQFWNDPLNRLWHSLKLQQAKATKKKMAERRTMEKP